MNKTIKRKKKVIEWNQERRYIVNYLENLVSQTHRYSLVPQILEWALQSDSTA